MMKRSTTSGGKLPFGVVLFKSAPKDVMDTPSTMSFEDTYSKPRRRDRNSPILRFPEAGGPTIISFFAESNIIYKLEYLQWR